jgi:hypothetical protein
MNALRSGMFASTALSEQQYRHVALRQFPDDCFHGPHARAGTFHEFCHNAVDGHFAVGGNRPIAPTQG